MRGFGKWRLSSSHTASILQNFFSGRLTLRYRSYPLTVFSSSYSRELKTTTQGKPTRVTVEELDEQEKPQETAIYQKIGEEKLKTKTKEQQGVAETTTGAELSERVAKRIARSGVCSRREAERLIQQGLVTVDGVPLSNPATTVTPTSVVRVGNKPLPAAPRPQIWLHYKKRGVVVTHKDPEGREALFPHLLQMGLPHLISVGRLDFESEGLLVLTNSGRIAHYMEHPSNCMQRTYRVRVHGLITQKKLNIMKRGIRIEGVHYAPIFVKVVPKRGQREGMRELLGDAMVSPQKGGVEPGTGGVWPTGNYWLEVNVAEGKNREVRKVLQHFGLSVTRLIRTRFGPFELGKLLPGDVLEVDRRLFSRIIKKAKDTSWWKWNPPPTA